VTSRQQGNQRQIDDVGLAFERAFHRTTQLGDACESVRDLEGEG
jgi:hypothetical protein